MTIEARGITKSFGSFPALRGVDLHVKEGELVALLGPSGSGKTTLLRVIAGLEFPDRGGVLFDGEDATERGARDRRVGFVFQHYALFRHMSVFENVAFGLRVRPRRARPGDAEIRERVSELLHLVQLGGMAERLPSQLSGGQRQRVALARALAVRPRVLLLDEPFGALDSRVRKELRRWLRQLHDELHITSLFVTHDQEEALELADRVVVMNQGRIEQVGTPDQVYHEPASRFVYEFLGDVNIFHERSEDPRQASIYVRPHAVDIARRPNGPSTLRARVQRVHVAGPTVKVELLTEHGGPVQAEISQEQQRRLALARDEEVWVRARESRTFTEDYSI
jgi:sulfate transport system ATP-binding protein